MYIPSEKKDYYSLNSYIERTIPKGASTKVSKGQKVLPYDSLAKFKFSYNKMFFPLQFEPAVNAEVKYFFMPGQKLGYLNNKSVKATYEGYLIKHSDGYEFYEKEKEVELLSGVWGDVFELTEESILLKTQTLNLKFAAAFDSYLEGELVVLPNPKSLELQKEYLKRYIKNPTGQIVYVGDYAHPEIISLAAQISVKALLAGSCDREAYSQAKSKGMFIGLFTGFGNLNTPNIIFNMLKDISNRYVFIRGQVNELLIPVPSEALGHIKKSAAQKTIKYVKKGLIVEVLQSPNFGRTGVVDRVNGSSIFVKLDENGEVIEVNSQNLITIGE